MINLNIYKSQYKFDKILSHFKEANKKLKYPI